LASNILLFGLPIEATGQLGLRAVRRGARIVPVPGSKKDTRMGKRLRMRTGRCGVQSREAEALTRRVDSTLVRGKTT